MTAQQHQAVEFDIAIIGYGPTGATLANLLGQLGHRVVVLEREAQAHHLPRAVHFDEEVMRVFQTTGLAEPVEQIARVNPGMRFVDSAGQLLLDWPRPSGIGPGGWHTSYRFHQPDLERVLRSGVDRYPRVSVQSECEFTGYSDDGESVLVRYTDVVSRQQHEVSARYLVGADGGRSTVRRLMQVATVDLGFRESWLVVDVLLKEQMEHLGDYTIQYCNPDQPATYVRCPGNRRRWEIAVPDGKSVEEMTQPDMVWQLLGNWLQPSQADIERAAVYTFHSMIASRWRCGRVVIAGDAAHQMPPFMGQGMCAGIRDVSNLGWKLSRCIGNGHSNALLDSYQSERYVHVQAYIETAVRLGTLLNSCETVEALQSAMSDKDGTPTLKSIAPRLGPGVVFDKQRQVNATLGNRAATAVDDAVIFSDTGVLSACGTLAGQPAIDGTLLDDVVGYEAVLLIEDQLVAATDLAVLEGVRVEPVCGHLELAKMLTELNVSAVLIRPDRYIYGCANDVAQLATLIVSARHDGLLEL
jgi:3-(3-hydroxy-phenyl)propionate hydroxylase